MIKASVTPPRYTSTSQHRYNTAQHTVRPRIVWRTSSAVTDSLSPAQHLTNSIFIVRHPLVPFSLCLSLSCLCWSGRAFNNRRSIPAPTWHDVTRHQATHSAKRLSLSFDSASAFVEPARSRGNDLLSMSIVSQVQTCPRVIWIPGFCKESRRLCIAPVSISVSLDLNRRARGWMVNWPCLQIDISYTR